MSARVCTASAKSALDPELDETQTLAPNIKIFDPMAMFTARDSESTLRILPNPSDRGFRLPPRGLRAARVHALKGTERWP